MADRYSSRRVSASPRENEDDDHRVDRKYDVSIQEEQKKIWNRAQLCEDEPTELSLILSDPFLCDPVFNTQNSAEEPTSQFCSLDVERSLEQSDLETGRSLILSDPFLCDPVSNTQNSAEEPTCPFCNLDLKRCLEQSELETELSLIWSDPFLCDPISNTQTSPEEPKSPFCSFDVERSLEQSDLSLSEREAIMFRKTEDQLFMTEQARRFLDDDK